MPSKCIGVIGAMEIEIRHLLTVLENSKTEQVHNLTFHGGQLAGALVVVCQCSPGKVNAARCAPILIDRYAPDVLINSGIAGGIDPVTEIGDCVIATGLVQHDFDVSGFAAVRGFMCVPDADRMKPTIWPADQALAQEMATATQAAFADDSPEAKVHLGLIATGDQFVQTQAVKEDLWETFHPQACEMEGGAIAQVAALCGVPFGCLRILSDKADGSKPDVYDAWEREKGAITGWVMETVIRHLGQGATQ